MEVDDAPPPRQQILVSRSFGTPIMHVDGILEAVSEFASRAAERLRQQGSVAGAIGVFFTTSPFRTNDRQHSVNVTLPLVRPTGDTAALVRAAAVAVRAQFRAGFRYAKAGAVLSDLQAGRATNRASSTCSRRARGSRAARRADARARQADVRHGRAQPPLRPRLGAPGQPRRWPATAPRCACGPRSRSAARRATPRAGTRCRSCARETENTSETEVFLIRCAAVFLEARPRVELG